MKIIGGEHKGRGLLSPRTLLVRPTSDRVRENIFNIIRSKCEGAVFLDLFAGVGTVGLEALSRGAESVTFVDSSSQSLSYLRKNTKPFQGNIIIYPVKSKVALVTLAKRGKKFDLVFVDPPFDHGYVHETLDLLDTLDLLNEGFLVIVQHAAQEPVQDQYKKMKPYDTRKYGMSCVTFLN